MNGGQNLAMIETLSSFVKGLRRYIDDEDGDDEEEGEEEREEEDSLVFTRRERPTVGKKDPKTSWKEGVSVTSLPLRVR